MKLYGKENITAYFTSALRNEMVGHLYIFEGAVGMGKKLLAQYIASMLLCEGLQKPCHRCHHCIKADAGNHPDIIWIKEEDGKALSVETARSFAAEMHIKPFLSERKIYIIPDGETLSPAVQNTLLKVFEEPPHYVTVFVTTTTRAALLKTVLSRAMVLPVNAPSLEAMTDFIREEYPVQSENAALIATLANGSIGQASLLSEDDTYLTMRSALYTSLTSLLGERKDIYCILECFETYKTQLAALLSLFSVWMRDVQFAKLSAVPKLLNYDFENEILTFSQCIPATAAIRCYDAAMQVASHIGKGSNYTLWITDFLLQCWRLCHDSHNRRSI